MAIGWAVTAVLFFYWTDSSYQGTLNVFLYCFILIACPFRLGMIYKIFVGYFMSSLGAAVLIRWVVYRISEQFYLLT